jgi:hypothetical protein
LYAADATRILYPKQVVASFVTGGSAAGCGFFHGRAEARILGAPPVLADYTWRMPGGIEKAWASEAVPLEDMGTPPHKGPLRDQSMSLGVEVVRGDA